MCQGDREGRAYNTRVLRRSRRMVRATLVVALDLVARTIHHVTRCCYYGCRLGPPGAVLGAPAGRIEVGGRLFASVIILGSGVVSTLVGSTFSSTSQFDNALVCSDCSVFASITRDGSIARICTMR